MNTKSITILTGFLGDSPKTFTTPAGTRVAKFQMATHEWNFKLRQREAQWHQIVVWGKPAEWCEELSRGAHVQVIGTIRYRMYNGAKITEIHCQSIEKVLTNPNGGSKKDDPEDFPAMPSSETGDEIPYD